MVWTKRSDPFGIKTLLLNKIPMQKVDCKHRIYYEVYSAHHKINKKSSNYWLSQPTPLTNNCLPANWLLWYVSRKAIFGAGMGRDDGYYCGVLSSGVNLFLVEGSSFHSIHWSFIVRDLLAVSWQLLYQVYIGPCCCQHQTSTKQLYLMQHWNERRGSNHSRIIPYQKDFKWLRVMSAYCFV